MKLWVDRSGVARGGEEKRSFPLEKEKMSVGLEMTTISHIKAVNTEDDERREQ